MKKGEKISPASISEEQRSEFYQLAFEVNNYIRSIAYPQATHIVAEPSFQRILRMGKPIIPLLLETLRNGSPAWFLALTSVTGLTLEDKEPDWKKDEQFPHLEGQKAAWLEWGARNGFVDKQLDLDLTNT